MTTMGMWRNPVKNLGGELGNTWSRYSCGMRHGTRSYAPEGWRDDRMDDSQSCKDHFGVRGQGGSSRGVAGASLHSWI